MRFVATVLGVIASLVMLAVSGSMNFLFMASLGKSETESLVLGAASASADGLKALLPFFIWWGWQEKRRLLALAGSFVWLFFVGFSLLSAVGFSASNRGVVTDTREGLAATFETAQSDLAESEAKRSSLPSHRPSAVVSEEIERLKQNRRWTSTDGCKDATASRSRAFCDGFFGLRSELASAVVGERLETRINGLKREVQRLRNSGAGRDADPQVSILSKIFGHGEDRVKLLLILVVAGLVELGSSLGLWLSTAHSEVFKRRGDASKSVRSASSDASRRTVKRKTKPVKVSVREPEPLAIEARKMGDVESYCLARLDPAPEGLGVSLEDLRRDYVAWCEAGNEDAYGVDQFQAHIRVIADEIDVPEVGGRLEGITIRKGRVSRAA